MVELQAYEFFGEKFTPEKYIIINANNEYLKRTDKVQKAMVGEEPFKLKIELP